MRRILRAITLKKVLLVAGCLFLLVGVAGLLRYRQAYVVPRGFGLLGDYDPYEIEVLRPKLLLGGFGLAAGLAFVGAGFLLNKISFLRVSFGVILLLFAWLGVVIVGVVVVPDLIGAVFSPRPEVADCVDATPADDRFSPLAPNTAAKVRVRNDGYSGFVLLSVTARCGERSSEETRVFWVRGGDTRTDRVVFYGLPADTGPRTYTATVEKSPERSFWYVPER